MAREVRLVDEMGELLGVMKLDEARAIAREKEVDLVEISPKADPPVCKVIDYGKMLYAQKKKEQHAKKQGKALEIKGIRLTFRMAGGDLERQRKLAENFLTKGHSLRVQLLMKGREMAHRDLANEKMDNFIKLLEEVAMPDQHPKGSRNQIIALLRPHKKTNENKP